MNILFICSRNQWRSPTAEAMYKDEQGLQVKSAGTAASARIKVNGKMISWAELIFVMEKKHKQQLKEKFAGELGDKKIIVLDIPDEYKFMDEELIENIRVSVSPYLPKN